MKLSSFYNVMQIYLNLDMFLHVCLPLNYF